MDPSVLGTGQIVLSRASAAPGNIPSVVPLPPGCGTGGCIPPVGTSCVIQGVSIDPQSLFMTLSWAPPSGSPADLPLVFTYKSASSNSTEFGSNWSAPYHRFAEPNTRINPHPVTVNTPGTFYNYTNLGTTYSTKVPGQNTLTGNATTGWSETQPDGTSFNYDSTGLLRTIRNRAGVRWTLTWDAGLDLVQAIQGPFGRRTSFVYNASSFVKRIVEPGGRITSLTVNANSDLAQIVSPQLCVTSFIYDGSHHLRAWVNPLGDRTSFIYQSSGTSLAVQQPMGQRTTYVSGTSGTVITNPRAARTTINYCSQVRMSSPTRSATRPRSL